MSRARLRPWAYHAVALAIGVEAFAFGMTMATPWALMVVAIAYALINTLAMRALCDASVHQSIEALNERFLREFAELNQIHLAHLRSLRRDDEGDEWKRGQR